MQSRLLKAFNKLKKELQEQLTEYGIPLPSEEGTIEAWQHTTITSAIYKRYEKHEEVRRPLRIAIHNYVVLDNLFKYLTSNDIPKLLEELKKVTESDFRFEIGKLINSKSNLSSAGSIPKSSSLESIPKSSSSRPIPKSSSSGSIPKPSSSRSIPQSSSSLGSPPQSSSSLGATSQPSSPSRAIVQPDSSSRSILEPSSSSKSILEPSFSSRSIVQPGSPPRSILEPSSSSRSIAQPGSSSAPILPSSSSSTESFLPRSDSSRDLPKNMLSPSSPKLARPLGYKKISGYVLRARKSKYLIDWAFDSSISNTSSPALDQYIRLLFLENNVSQRYLDKKIEASQIDPHKVYSLISVDEQKKSGHFFEGLLRTMSFAELNDASKFISTQKAASKKTIQDFEEKFFEYQLEHADKLFNWQHSVHHSKPIKNEEKRSPQEEKKEELREEKRSYHEEKKEELRDEKRSSQEEKNVEPSGQGERELLLGIRLIILNKKWSLGLFGGTSIRGRSYPAGVAEILSRIEAANVKAQNATPENVNKIWETASTDISKICTAAAAKKPHSYKIFYKRHDSTQNFYTKVREKIQQEVFNTLEKEHSSSEKRSSPRKP